MTEPTPGLDLVRELHELVKDVRESKSIAEIFAPIAQPLAELIARENARAAAPEPKPQFRQLPDTVWKVREFVDLCTRMGLDPRDPATPQILKSLRESIE